MAVKLFVSDLDGTMLPSGDIVSSEKIAAVQCAVREGVTVTIATGRMFEAALPVAEALGVDVPIIAYNGALIKSPSGRIYEEHAIDPMLARDIITFAQARGWYIQSYSGGVLRYAVACEESRFYEDSQKITGKAVGRDGTMAIGDAYNDLPMLKAAGKSVAMGNAFPEVKEEADYETLSCTENGLAAAIYTYVLGMGANAPVPIRRG